MTRAWQQIEAGLELVEKHALVVPRQFLYSTRGELALAEGELAEAEAWFERALSEAQRNDNRSHIANRPKPVWLAGNGGRGLLVWAGRVRSRLA